jgi:hypothetical protein
VLVLLGVYAIGWQQVIKRMPLSSAYANRAVTVIWGLFWGVVLFGESITPGKIIGALLIVAGIALYAHIDRDDAAEDADAATCDDTAKDADAAIVDAATCDDAASNRKHKRAHDDQSAVQSEVQSTDRQAGEPANRQAGQPADQQRHQLANQPTDQPAAPDGRDRL